MKTALIFSYVLIGVLAFFAFMQWRTLANLNVAIEKFKAANTNKPAESEDNNPNKIAGDWINELQNSVKELEVKFVSK